MANTTGERWLKSPDFNVPIAQPSKSPKFCILPVLPDSCSRRGLYLGLQSVSTADLLTRVLHQPKCIDGCENMWVISIGQAFFWPHMLFISPESLRDRIRAIFRQSIYFSEAGLIFADRNAAAIGYAVAVGSGLNDFLMFLVDSDNGRFELLARTSASRYKHR